VESRAQFPGTLTTQAKNATQHEEGSMPKYVVLFNYTDQGIKNIKSGPERRSQLRLRTQELGITSENYLTIGTYDRVAIVDAPSEEAMAQYMLYISSRGNVRSTTLRAFTADEEDQILKGMPGLEGSA
jgi:uncharacterized protein with GYD domain